MAKARKDAVFFAVPSNGSMRVRTALCLAAQFASLPVPASLNSQPGPYVHRNRELLMEDALKDERFSHLMFVDTDLVFPPDGVQRLLAHDKDLVGGAYNMRKFPPTSAVKLLDRQVGPQPTEGLFECDAVPTGFMLVRLDAVRDLPKPWFWFEEDEHGLIGEDSYFCLKMKEHGKKVWCDPTIPIGHIGEFVY